MPTQKQITANTQNAQLSTGPVSVSGKAVVSANAIKHGIFTKDLILSSNIGQECENEYQEILTNLEISLSPCDQIQSLLVEKIAVDFWRLRRIIRFETGSLAENIKSLVKEFYSYGVQNNEKIDQEINYKQQVIKWNLSYIECLSKNQVTFDQPMWQGNEINSEIIEDLLLIAKTINDLTKPEREKLYSYQMNFEEMRALLKKYGYNESKQISEKLIEIFIKQNKQYEEDIQKLAKQKLMNDISDKLTYTLGMTPTTENTDKILKYERSIQKSIYQNLFMLKKLQSGI